MVEEFQYWMFNDFDSFSPFFIVFGMKSVVDENFGGPTELKC